VPVPLGVRTVPPGTAPPGASVTTDRPRTVTPPRPFGRGLRAGPRVVGQPLEVTGLGPTPGRHGLPTNVTRSSESLVPGVRGPCPADVRRLLRWRAGPRHRHRGRRLGRSYREARSREREYNKSDSYPIVLEDVYPLGSRLSVRDRGSDSFECPDDRPGPPGATRETGGAPDTSGRGREVPDDDIPTRTLYSGDEARRPVTPRGRTRLARAATGSGHRDARCDSNRTRAGGGLGSAASWQVISSVSRVLSVFNFMYNFDTCSV